MVAVHRINMESEKRNSRRSSDAPDPITKAAEIHPCTAYEDQDSTRESSSASVGNSSTLPSPSASLHQESEPPLSTTTTTTTKLTATNPLDQGHRYGNFHNYYAFHPPSARMTLMKDIIDHVGSSWSPRRLEKQMKKSVNDEITTTSDESSSEQKQQQVLTVRNHPFTYLDVGCNEGDLTMEVARALQLKLGTTVHVTGIDIDAILIHRANQKYNNKSTVVDNEEGSSMMVAHFQVADVCQADQRDQVVVNHQHNANNDTMFDLTTLFSTTMWIHVHVGDQGLTKVLQQLCQKTRHFLIIEPQPSKCYRNAMVRLRKLGRPELDVSANRLELRNNVADAIDSIVTKCGFQRVDLKELNSSTTCWNRSLQLYERTINHNVGASAESSQM